MFSNKRLALVSLALNFLYPQIWAATVSTPTFKPGELIVKFKTSPSAALTKTINPSATALGSVNRLNGKHRVRRMQRVFDVSAKANHPAAQKLGQIFQLKIDDNEDVVKAAQEYSKDPNVEYAEPNYVYETSVVPNDPGYAQQWALQKIQAPAAWNLQTGNSGVVIAIIDTGIDYNHPDLQANIWTNSGEIAGNNIDDDGNGFVDDVQGWNFSFGNTEPGDSIMNSEAENGTAEAVGNNDPKDDNGHGTHCAGIAGAVGNNAVGISGISWNCKLMAVKGLSAAGSGSSNRLAQAILYAANNGAKVISNSWGGGHFSQTLQDAINYASNVKGVVVMCAAGNGANSGLFYPAAYNNSVAVASTDSSDIKSGFSNFGSWVDIAAPGSDIYSTMPTYPVTISGQGYTSLSGTSMATPYVAGLAGLLRSQFPLETNAQIIQRIQILSDDISAINPGYVGTLGAGRINAYRALTETPSNNSVSGYVKDAAGNGVGGCTMALVGGVFASAITRADGYYEFTNIPGPRNYTLVASHPEYTMAPASLKYAPLNANQINQNFVATKLSPWSAQMIDSNNSGKDNAQVAEANGMIHVAYCDVNNALRYAKWNGATWAVQTVDAAGGGSFVSIAIDSANNPHIAYYDQANQNLKYAKWIGTGWSIQTLDSTGDVGSENSIAIDSAGTVHVCYSDKTAGTVKRAKWSSNSWKIDVVSGGGFSPRVALDPNGNPYVAFLSKFDKSPALTHWTGFSWRELFVSVPSLGDIRNGAYCINIALALDPTGTPHLVYSIGKAGSDIINFRYTKLEMDGSLRNEETFDIGSFDGQKKLSVVMDKNNLPHIAYDASRGAQGNTKYATYLGEGRWSRELVNSGVGKSSISLDPNGRPKIAFIDDSNGTLRIASPPTLSSLAIRGYVRDNSARPLPGMPVDLSGPITTRVFTDSTGSYEFVKLSAGNYTVAPYKEFGAEITPSNRVYSNLTVTQDNQNFTGKNLWDIKLVDPAVDAGRYVSMSLDSFGNPHMVYYDSANLILKYANWNGTAWIVNPVGPTGEPGQQCSMVVDSLNNVHLAYFETTTGNIKYANRKGGVWTMQTVDVSGYPAGAISIVLDSFKNPHIAYYDAAGKNLKYANWTANAWITETVESSGDAGLDASLALDANNAPHIAYHQVANSVTNTKYATPCSNCGPGQTPGWKIMQVGTGGVRSQTAIAIDLKGAPHIGYHSVENNVRLLRHAVLDGNQWTIETVDTAYPDSSGSLGMALDLGRGTRFSYYSLGDRSHKYAEWVGTGWSTQTIEPNRLAIYNDDLIFANQADRSMALDSNGVASVAFYDRAKKQLFYAKSVSVPLQRYYISGRVLDSSMQGIAGVTVALTGDPSQTDVTSSDGYYQFMDLSLTNYNVTATKLDHTFTPTSYTYGPLTGNRVNQNFTGQYIGPPGSPGDMGQGATVGISMSIGTTP